ADSVPRGCITDVARQYDVRAELRRQRLHALFQRLTLVGKGQLCPLRGNGFGNSPGDRAVVGDTHDETALTGHQVSRSDTRIRSVARHEPLSPSVSCQGILSTIGANNPDDRRRGGLPLTSASSQAAGQDLVFQHTIVLKFGIFEQGMVRRRSVSLALGFYVSLCKCPVR